MCRRAWLTVAGAAAVLALLIPPGSAAVADEPAPLNGGQAASSQPVTVDVPMPTVPAPGRQGMNGVVEIRVGRSAPFLVMVDTGSVGLRVFPGAWGSTPRGVTLTDQRLQTGTGGDAFRGLLGRSPLTIGGVTTTRAIGFQYVNTDAAIIRGWAAKRVYGILGIGTGRYRLANPLSALPGEAGLRWSVHLGGDPLTRRSGMGHLVLGARQPTSAIASFQLPPLGPDGYGALLWDDHKAPGCWTFGTMRETCVDTWFDSGFHPMRVKGADFRRVPVNAAGQVRPGTSIALADVGSAFEAWRFRAGRTASADQVRILAKGRPGINTGNAPFFRFTVSYDVANGLVSLSDRRG
ncbi:MAG: hypothetical protein GC156_15090 [Actinomycetales bacterium]|nr:hypothetical protein [Actinomycetales bacterium]